MPAIAQTNKHQVQIVLFITLGYITWEGTAKTSTTQSGTKGTTDGWAHSKLGAGMASSPGYFQGMLLAGRVVFRGGVHFQWNE
jgi:hypothetical protein